VDISAGPTVKRIKGNNLYNVSVITGSVNQMNSVCKNSKNLRLDLNVNFKNVTVQCSPSSKSEKYTNTTNEVIKPSIGFSYEKKHDGTVKSEFMHAVIISLLVCIIIRLYYKGLKSHTVI
jgi:hypothetical protein